MSSAPDCPPLHAQGLNSGTQQTSACSCRCSCSVAQALPPQRLTVTYNYQTCKLLNFPVEILTQIALACYYPSDAMSLSQTHPVFRKLLGPTNQLFWYKITRPHMPNIVSPDAYKFNSGEDYHGKVVNAFSKKDNSSRCQICCVKRAYKQWTAFHRRICPDCFDEVTVDRVTIRFLRLPEESYRVQKRYRGQSIRWACWLPDVHRALEKHQPGNDLTTLLRNREKSKRTQQDTISDYRKSTRQAVEACALEIYKEEFKYAHGLVSIDKFAEYCSTIYCQTLSNLPALTKPKKKVWIESVARSEMLPLWVPMTTTDEGVPLPPKLHKRKNIPGCFKTAFHNYHKERFITRNTGYNWGIKSEPDRTLLFGTCAICSLDILRDYVQKMKNNHRRHARHSIHPGQDEDMEEESEAESEAAEKVNPGDRQWFFPHELLNHYEGFHPKEFFSTSEHVSYNGADRGKGGFWFWDGVVRGVDDIEDFVRDDGSEEEDEVEEEAAEEEDTDEDEDEEEFTDMEMDDVSESGNAVAAVCAGENAVTTTTTITNTVILKPMAPPPCPYGSSGVASSSSSSSSRAGSGSSGSNSSSTDPSITSSTPPPPTLKRTRSESSSKLIRFGAEYVAKTQGETNQWVQRMRSEWKRKLCGEMVGKMRARNGGSRGEGSGGNTRKRKRTEMNV